MSRWKELPESLDPQLRQLVVTLREHKDRSGLSIAALATRTDFSKSSWDRYLNGRALPPEAAVQALARVCDTEPAPLLALRELATEAPDDAAATRTAATGAAPTGTEAESTAVPGRPVSGVAPADRPVHRPVPWLPMLLASVTTALVMLTGLLVLAPWEDATATAEEPAATGPSTGQVHPSLGEFVYRPGKLYVCDIERDDEDGKLYAGYSRTHSEMIQQDASRWSVVEAQCLLEHHGISPGTVDGAFGNNTDRAVRRLQDRAHIAVDGIVGPDTWKVLRG